MQRSDIYKCELCGNVSELVGVGGGKLNCCGQPMQLLPEQTADATTEKHVPILKDDSINITVIVGSTAHPMTEEHYIEWIEVINGDYVNRKYLEPGDAPEAEFYVHKQPGLILRSYCNLHGLWKNEI